MPDAQVLIHWFVPLPDPVNIPAVPWRSPAPVPTERHLVAVSAFPLQIDRQFNDDVTLALFDAASRALPGYELGEPQPVSGLRNPYTVMEIVAEFGPGVEPDEHEISDAFDLGMAVIARILDAYITVTKDPIRTPTREALPPLIPMFTRRATADEPGFPGSGGVLLVNHGSLRSGMVPEVGDEKWTDIQGLFTGAVFEFAGYVTSRTAAVRALDRDGDYRSAILSAATAGEVLIGDVALHLMWHDAMTPEDAAATLSNARHGVLNHAQNLIAPRVGGRWSVAQNGPVREWNDSVANVRHRVIHAGFAPDLEAARKALEATSKLEDFVIGVLCASRGLRSYPRTALALVGREGLQRRNLYNAGFVARAAWSGAGAPSEIFDRWRRSVDDERLRLGSRTRPSERSAQVVLVRRVDGTRSWFVFDTQSGFTAPTKDRTADIPTAQASRLSQLLADIDSRGVDGDISISVNDLKPTKPVGEWVLPYRVLPNHEVMFDGSDHR